MKPKLNTLVILLILLTSPVWAETANSGVAQAQRAAETLAQAPELPVNVRLRFQVLESLLPAFSSKGDVSHTLTFFSTTRILVWNRPLSPQVGDQMRDFEAQVVALARGKGFNLDVPPVGYSTAGVAGGALPTANMGQPASSSLLASRVPRESLAEAILRAEEMGTMALGQGNSSPLQALRDSLTVLRLDLADPTVASDAVRNVLLARAAFLASPASSGADPQLLQKLDAAADALRADFPPELLRQTRGQQLRI